MAVCSRSGLPLAWRVQTAAANEMRFAVPLIDVLRERGLAVETAAMDKGYNNGAIFDECEARDCRPIIPLTATPAVKRGETLAPPL
jgi:hypothetical protein